MKKILIIALLSFLPSCAQIQKAETGVKTAIANISKPDTFDDITVFYGSTLAVANAYGDLCVRSVINKSCWNVIDTVKPYEQKAYDSYIVLKKFVKSNPNLDATTLIKLAKDEITAWKQAQSNNGMK